MRVAVVKHHEIDDAGFIADAFAGCGAELSVHRYPEGGSLPALDGLDHIVVLGAAWSVYDHATIGHWVGAELDWLRAADAAGVPVLGICFGAQALCAALGGEVTHAIRPEVGWIEVEHDRSGLIEPGPWLEFHADECRLPAAATPLAWTEVCVQAFSIGPHLGVQFHPEVDGAQLDRWLRAGGDVEARAAGQDPAELLARTVAEEPLAAQRAGRLVATARTLAAPARAEESLPH